MSIVASISSIAMGCVVAIVDRDRSRRSSGRLTELQPASAARSPAASRSRPCGASSARPSAACRCRAPMTCPSGGHSKDEADSGPDSCRRAPAALDAVDAVETAEEDRCGHRSAARSRHRGAASAERRDRLHEIGRDDDDELGLVALEVAAAEKRAEDRQLDEARGARRSPGGRCPEETAHDHGAAGGKLHGGLGAANLRGREATRR